jgi:dTDP-4-amino-4,6-dideoxygalactose transaminase
MAVTDIPELAEKIKKLRNHGAEASDYKRHVENGGSLLPEFNMLGFNYRMTDMQGALGVAQMERLSAILKARREAALRYQEMLTDLKTVQIPSEPEGFTHAFQSYVVLYRGRKGQEPTLGNLAQLNLERNRLMDAMERDGITVRQGTHAVHTLGYYAKKYGLDPEAYPNSLIADRLSITLPLFPGISFAQQERVVSYLAEPPADV